MWTKNSFSLSWIQSLFVTKILFDHQSNHCCSLLSTNRSLVRVGLSYAFLKLDLLVFSSVAPLSTACYPNNARSWFLWMEVGRAPMYEITAWLLDIKVDNDRKNWPLIIFNVCNMYAWMHVFRCVHDFKENIYISKWSWRGGVPLLIICRITLHGLHFVVVV